MIDKKTVEHVAKLSRISLDEGEIDKLSEELSVVLDSFSVISEVDTNEVNPSFHPMELKNVVREDVPEECLTPEEALSNAEQKEDNFFKGPRSV
jgi:aspartyl-tRNA(Asn)/glutamyl-tRNA(Gln) amidotransferase subunit C